MAILAFLLLLLSFLALIVQLVTPLVINLVMMAIVLLAFAVAWLYLRRQRKHSRFPLFASANLLLQLVFVVFSFVVFFMVTLPYEQSGDSLAVVEGLRKILVRQGLLPEAQQQRTPQPTPKPEKNSEKSPQVQFSIEDNPTQDAKEMGEREP
ncbi:MAG: hypothetical protein NZL89_00895 [Leptospiraceae bacterium]|nr:hypothetical protein [Leptospiraceae bacterium]